MIPTTVHQFKCSENHVFFIPLDLPLSLNDIVEILSKIKCPLCNTKEISLNAEELKILKL